MTTAVGFLLGLVLGLALAAFGARAVFAPLMRSRQASLEAERDLLRERITDLEAAAGQDHELVATLSPLAATLQRVEKQVATLERDRVEQFSRLDEHLTAVHASGESLRAQTAALAGALRSPTSRGAWGEVQLRRVVEHAGMLPRVDFFTQASGTTPDGNGVRPDLLVNLPGGKYVVVDAKAPLAAFLEASEKGEAALSAAAGAHAKALRAHVDALAAKEYWTAFQPTPQLVVCFVPGEAFLAAACTADPSLLEHAMARRVVLATPTTLLALLRTVALTWQSEAVSGNARHLLEIGTELYRRLSGLGEHAGKLGRDLHRVVEDYNALVGTLERRVFVTARKMQDLGLVDHDLTALTPLESSPRPLTADELLTTPPTSTLNDHVADLRGDPETSSGRRALRPERAPSLSPESPASQRITPAQATPTPTADSLGVATPAPITSAPATSDRPALTPTEPFPDPHRDAGHWHR